jgi:hypothetical protein
LQRHLVTFQGLHPNLHLATVAGISILQWHELQNRNLRITIHYIYIYIHLLCIECLWRSLNALGNIYIFRDQQQWGHGHNGLKRDSTHCFQDNMHQSMAKDSEDLSICQSFVQFYRVTRFQETNSVSKGFEPSLIVCHPLPQVGLRNSRNGWFRSNPNQLVKHIPNFLDYIPISPWLKQPSSGGAVSTDSLRSA